MLLVSDEEAVMEESIIPAQSPLVSVTFQRNARRKEKFLEAEPKALGVPEIGLSLYTIICLGVLQSKGLSDPSSGIPIFIASLLVSTILLIVLRACLGMQILACGASIVNIICTLVKMGDWSHHCWYLHADKYQEVWHSPYQLVAVMLINVHPPLLIVKQKKKKNHSSYSSNVQTSNLKLASAS
uniref:Uncharacterized protein n=1 Tax=Nothobranchius furzeri TaxID=105023 RepID=A0A8C6P8D8_NOTFU